MSLKKSEKDMLEKSEAALSKTLMLVAENREVGSYVQTFYSKLKRWFWKLRREHSKAKMFPGECDPCRLSDDPKATKADNNWKGIYLCETHNSEAHQGIINIDHIVYYFKSLKIELAVHEYSKYHEFNNCDGELKHFKGIGGLVAQCPNCNHWNGIVVDYDVEGWNPDTWILCMCCGSEEEYE